MKVQVNITFQGTTIHEAFTGSNAEEVVGKMKARIAQELPFMMRVACNAMSPLMFAQELVRRYNEAYKVQVPHPHSCQEFLDEAQKQGIATLEAEI